MTRMHTDRLLNPRQVAERLNVTPRTVVRWVNEGRLKAVKVGRVWRIRESEVEKVVNRGI